MKFYQYFTDEGNLVLKYLGDSINFDDAIIKRVGNILGTNELVTTEGVLLVTGQYYNRTGMISGEWLNWEGSQKEFEALKQEYHIPDEYYGISKTRDFFWQKHRDLYTVEYGHYWKKLDTENPIAVTITTPNYRIHY